MSRAPSLEIGSRLRDYRAMTDRSSSISLIATFPLTFALTLGCAPSRPQIESIQSPTYQQTEEEREINEDSREFAKAIREADRIHEDEELQSYLQELLDVLLVAEGLEAGSVPLSLLAEPHLNAYTLAHGEIHLNLGIATQLENEAQMVFLLGHELAHYLERHALQKRLFEDAETTRVLWQRAALGVALLPLGLTPFATFDIEQEGMTRVLAPQLSGHSQDLEFASDRYGFRVLVRGGYAPSQAAAFTQRVMQDDDLTREELNIQDGDERDDPYYYASHPELAARLRELHALEIEFDEACSVEPPNERRTTKGDFDCASSGDRLGTHIYKAHLHKAVMTSAKLDEDIGRRSRAQRTLERVLGPAKEDAAGWTFLAELRAGIGPSADGLAPALLALDRSKESDADYPRAYRERGFVLERLGRVPEARMAFRRYLELDPDAKDRPLIEHWLLRKNVHLQSADIVRDATHDLPESTEVER